MRRDLSNRTARIERERGVAALKTKAPPYDDITWDLPWPGWKAGDTAAAGEQVPQPEKDRR
jgi:hypothetical protein